MNERFGRRASVALAEPGVRAETESRHEKDDCAHHPSLDNVADAILGFPMHVDKRSLIQDLRAVISRESGVLAAAAKDARAAATHEEAKPENDKDTRAIEAAYLAGAQAERVRELERVANALEFLSLRDFDDNDTVALTAIVALEHEGARTFYFISPVAGGMRARMGDIEVQVITPQSPMGQALVGRTVGEVVDVRKREYEIVSVR
jgi:transcription elongation GreA/GreB family factor